MDGARWTTSLQAAQAVQRALEDERLTRAAALIDAHFAEPLRLDVLAASAFLSPHHFHRRFRAVFGETPQQRVARRRLDRARRLLTRDGMSVTEACMAVGYASLGSFSARYRQRFGVSPTADRRRVVALGALRRRPGAVPACFAWRHGGIDLRKIGEASRAGGS